ncbi:predicted protein [Coccidioides posadasii str. Silveira]|uniref:Predicted protein n=1 Tax=Coccidioides posadasii (strain RMSCC 757 / Silveira) TaxID=443226 RepID=E9CWC6_COCPS|nr:predicted protein [Coccidioides posadasii str. Silveira]
MCKWKVETLQDMPPVDLLLIRQAEQKSNLLLFMSQRFGECLVCLGARVEELFGCKKGYRIRPPGLWLWRGSFEYFLRVSAFFRMFLHVSVCLGVLEMRNSPQAWSLSKREILTCNHNGDMSPLVYATYVNQPTRVLTDKDKGAVPTSEVIGMPIGGKALRQVRLYLHESHRTVSRPSFFRRHGTFSAAEGRRLVVATLFRCQMGFPRVDDPLAQPRANGNRVDIGCFIALWLLGSSPRWLHDPGVGRIWQNKVVPDHRALKPLSPCPLAFGFHPAQKRQPFRLCICRGRCELIVITLALAVAAAPCA